MLKRRATPAIDPSSKEKKEIEMSFPGRRWGRTASAMQIA
jgi:hypothetical protein